MIHPYEALSQNQQGESWAAVSVTAAHCLHTKGNITDLGVVCILLFAGGHFGTSALRSPLKGEECVHVLMVNSTSSLQLS